MIDFIKLQLFIFQSIFIPDLIANGFEIHGKYDLITGEIRTYPLIAVKGDLKIVFKSDGFVQLTGSLHKYSRNGTNHDDFTYADLIKTIIDLLQSIKIDPFTSILHNIEFGVNINLPFGVKKFLKYLLNHAGKNFTALESRDGHSLGFECRHRIYRIKIYSKKSQYDLQHETMRFEVHVDRMQYLTTKGINLKYLSDLFDLDILRLLGNHLIEVFNEIVIVDKSIDVKALSKADKKIYDRWINPLEVERLHEESKSIFRSERRRYREIQEEYSKDNWQQIVASLISEKINELLRSDDETDELLRQFQSFRQSKNFDEYSQLSGSPPSKNLDGYYQPSSTPVSKNFDGYFTLSQREYSLNKETKRPDVLIHTSRDQDSTEISIEKSKLNYKKSNSPVRVSKRHLEEETKPIFIETSFTGTDGKLYIPHPLQPDRVAVYNSMESYNLRLHLPVYIDRMEAELLFFEYRKIDLGTLQVL